MANTGTSVFRKQNQVRIPKLLVQVDKFYNNPLIHSLPHGALSADPTADNYFDWTDPRFTLFTRDMTQDILDMKPVIIMQRYLTNARNPYKGDGYAGSKVKRWVVPGNSSFNGEPVNAGDSSTNDYGVPSSEVVNFIPWNNPDTGGYTHHYKYTLPVSRFTSDRTAGQYLTQLSRAIYSADWNDQIVFSQHRSMRNYHMIFKLSLGIPNPDYELNKSLNQYLIGEGQTIIVTPRLHTFDDGSGLLEYYIAWNVKVRE